MHKRKQSFCGYAPDPYQDSAPGLRWNGSPAAQIGKVKVNLDMYRTHL